MKWIKRKDGLKSIHRRFLDSLTAKGHALYLSSSKDIMDEMLSGKIDTVIFSRKMSALKALVVTL